MQTYICKCGKTFEKSTKAETTGYKLHDYSPQHECYGCPYIVTERDWQTNEIAKRECRATPKITYLSKCHIGTRKGDFTACKVYSLDLTFVKRIMNYVNTLDGAETGDHLNRIPSEWRAADFGMCYSSDNCFGLAIFNLHFKNNKKGTEARRLVKERFFSESGIRKDMTEEKERETILMRIQIAKENARKASEQNAGEPTEADIALVEMSRDLNGTYFDVFLEHYPNFDASRFDEFAEDVCAAECFDDVNEYLGGTAGKYAACKISCKECWKDVCALQWKLSNGTEKYIEPYLSAKEEENTIEQNAGEPTEADIALFEQYIEYFGRACRFEKAYGSEHKYTKQHWDKANELYNEILRKGLEQAYKKYREEKREPTEEEENMARKLQFDAAITKDIKSAASDSFIDNIKMIDVSEIVPSKENFYEMSNIELLADDIEREGLKTNLLVSKEKNGSKYLLKSGHRRFSAIKLLISEKRLTNTKVPCLVDGEKTKAESKLDLIMLNATQRKYTDAEVMSEYEQLSQILKELDSEGKGLGGRMRDNIAKILNISNGQVGKLDNIKHNAAPEVKKAVEDGKMSISTANEVAKLAPEKQKEVIEKKPDISSAEVKEMQSKKPAAPSKPASSPAPAESRITYFDPDAEPDDFDDNDSDFETEKLKSELKRALTFSLILSEGEAKALLEFINDNIAYVDNDDELITIQSRLEDFVG